MMIKITEHKATVYILNLTAFLSIFLYYFMSIIEDAAYRLIIEYQRLEYFSGVYILGTLSFYIEMLILLIAIAVNFWVMWIEHAERRKAYL